MIKVGINGFGRIGKCVFMQLLNNSKFEICAINVPNMKITEIEDYLRYDSVHHYNKHFTLSIVSDNSFKINNENLITLLSDRNAENLNWKQYGCEYLIDATGAYLTTEKCQSHNIDYVVMSSPPKDNTNTFIYGTNQEKYKGENIVSGSSCTTNCVGPMLKILNDNYNIKYCSFTTIHSSTASQNTVDSTHTKSRTSRSIINNIIPHTTGASASITKVLPELFEKVYGTSIRVPVTTGSLVNLFVEFDEGEEVTLDSIKNLLKASPYFNKVFQVSQKNLVSSDFTSTTTPTILDVNASVSIGQNKFKLVLWYDNEWSYSSQLIRLVNYMFEYNNVIKEKYYINNLDLNNKKVVCRVDFNIVMKDGKIVDDFRIRSAIPTIKHILSQNPQYVILASHFGRPVLDKGSLLFDEKYSLKAIVDTVTKYLEMDVVFLPHGISELTLHKIEHDVINKNLNKNNDTKPTVYLLENLRFHTEETSYDKINIDGHANEVINLYKHLGNVYISDAFGCAHRKHMSIYGIKNFDQIGYGDLMKKEVESLNTLVNSHDKKILCIMGGNKVADKMPLIDCLRLLPNSTIYVGGGIARSYNESHTNVIVMHDAFGNKKMDDIPEYIKDINDIYDKDSNTYEYNLFDIGTESLSELFKLIDESDVIFWNGSLGVIEHDIYRKSSTKLMEYLNNIPDKTVIIGGGETASLVETTSDNVYVSTGGGALLEYVRDKILYGKNIPGLDIFT